ncbi:MAG: DUF2989 domain-containing protein [Psychrobium sp.]
MNTKKATLITSIISLSLTGCFSDEKSIYGICDDHPEICMDIETKGWCKQERSSLIRNRYQQIIAPDDEENLYNSLINWKKFSECIETASNIKRKNLKDRDPTKATSFVNSVAEIEKLEKLTKNSQLPQLLYYHWAQDGDDKKIDRLLKLDKKGELQTTELQMMMASYYDKRDRKKAAKAHYKALSYLTQQDLETLDHGIFASLSTYFYQASKPKLSYVWAQVAIKFGLRANLYSSLTAEVKKQGGSIDELDEKAQKVYDSIQSLNFKPPK